MFWEDNEEEGLGRGKLEAEANGMKEQDVARTSGDGFPELHLWYQESIYNLIPHHTVNLNSIYLHSDVVCQGGLLLSAIPQAGLVGSLSMIGDSPHELVTLSKHPNVPSAAKWRDRYYLAKLPLKWGWGCKEGKLAEGSFSGSREFEICLCSGDERTVCVPLSSVTALTLCFLSLL